MVQQARLWLQVLRCDTYLDALDHWDIPRHNPMSVEQAFVLITRAGASALRRSDLGVIQEGAKADIMVYSTDAPNMIGWSDAVAAIILHLDVGDIEDVIFGDKFVKRDGKLLYDDYANLKRKLIASAHRIQSIWSSMDWPALEGKISAYGGPYGQARTIDTLGGNGTGY